MNTVPNRFKKIREDRGMTITAIAELLGEKRQRMQDIEMGKQRIPEDVLVKFIEYFNVDANWLLTGEGDMYRHAPQATDNPKIQKMQELMDGLSENQQQEIFLAVAEKKRLNQLERLISDMSKGERKPNPADMTAELRLTA